MREVHNTARIIMGNICIVLFILLAFVICASRANLKISGENESLEEGLCSTHADCPSFQKCLNVTSGRLICSCKPGRSGEQCETIDECIKGEYEDCKGNNGLCVYNEEKEVAECDCGTDKKWDAWKRRCRVPCQHSDCHHEQYCFRVGDFKFCKCDDRFTGDHCEKVVECDLNPEFCGSKSDVKCYYSSIFYRTMCECDDPNKVFDDKIKECRNLCNRFMCKNGGECELVEGEMKCNCKLPYTGDTCETKCFCENGRCVADKHGKMKCACNPKHVLTNDETCKPCDCGSKGKCILQMKALNGSIQYHKMCICDKGSAEKNGECVDCQCGPNSQCEFIGEEERCYCADGYSEKEGVCTMCDCGSKGKCLFRMKALNGSVQYHKMCVCDKGSEEKNGECVDCQCGPNSLCEFKDEEKRCYCVEGYSEKDGVCTKDCECEGGFCELDGNENNICKCPPEYGLYRNLCEECNCGKGANCTITQDWFPKLKQCICPKGYSSDFMSSCKGDCRYTPCENGGTCKVAGEDIECLCTPQYVGERCENKPCATNPCKNDGKCELEDGKFICKCKGTFTGNRCETNACDPNPCRNEGLCSLVKGKVRCSCKGPFYGNRCGEVDKCDLRPCKNGGKCEIIKGKVKCTCRDPYTGVKCDKKLCDSNPCKNGGICYLVQEKEDCTCQVPYTGDLCDKIDKCASHPCQNGGTCRNENDDFECTCTENYRGKDCSIGNAWCDKYGQHWCGKEKCQYNETIGKGYCVCENGKIFHEASKTCMVDHCASSPCQNGGNCRNGNYTFECICTGNYGGKNCSENVWCDKYGQYLCGKEICQYNETIGKGYCVCENGKIFHELSKTCLVPNPCFQNPCKNNGRCENEYGKYKCFCKDGYTGYECEIEPDPCYLNPCKNNGNCENENGKYKCFCKDGYTGDECEIDPNPCYPNPCKNNEQCTSENGKAKCRYGYTRDECGIDYRYILAAVLLLVFLAAICLCCGCYLFRTRHTFLPQDSVDCKIAPCMS